MNVLSTNGTLYAELREIFVFCQTLGMPIPDIHISIDGDESLHDAQRGVRGSFRKSVQTVIKIKKEFQDVRIKLKCTITKMNIPGIDFVYNLA